MNKSNSEIIKSFVLRTVIVYVIVFLISVAIIVQVFNLMVVQRSKWEQINSNSTKEKVIVPKRANILSRNENILATSVPWYQITIDLRTPEWKRYFVSPTDSLSKNINAVCYELSKYTKGKTPSEVKQELKTRYKSKKQFYLNHRFNYPELKKLKELPILNKGKYKSGLVIEQRSRRVKPYDNLAFRTIGQLSQTGRGNAGLEMAYNEYLSGEAGKALMQRLPGGVWMPVNDGNIVEPKEGFDLITTIDIGFQDIVHYALEKQLIATKANHGSAILMDVQTGEILAISNLTDTLGRYLEYYNYAIGERTEPGSTMKLMSLMAGIEDGYIKLTDTVDTGNGKFKYSTLTIRDTHKGGYGKLTVKEAFKVSSNVGIVKTILKHYENRQKAFIDRLYNMNLHNKLGVSIPGEPMPIIKYPTDSLWWKGSLAQISYGYELKFTPMQILAFYNAVANNGRLVKPRFAKYLKKGNHIIKRYKTETIDRSICSKSTIRKAQELLECVVDDGFYIDEDGKRQQSGMRGTGHNIETKHYKIAGKTGTAQIAIGTSGYGGQNKKYQASFVGYFPADNPKYSCIVVVNSPKRGGYYGNIIAGTVFREISDKVYAQSFSLFEEDEDKDSESNMKTPYSEHGYLPEINEVIETYDIPVCDTGITSEWVLTYNRDSLIEYRNRFISGNMTVPNVIGMGLKDALFILENKGLRVIIEGHGTVKKQWPKHGTSFRKGTVVKLMLNKKG